MTSLTGSADYQKLRQLPFELRAQVAVQTGQQAEAAGQTPFAQTCYRLAARLDPSLSAAYDGRARLERDTRDLEAPPAAAGFTVIDRRMQPAAYAALATPAIFPGFDASPFQASIARAVNAAICGGAMDDLSFALTQGGQPVMLVECDVAWDRSLARFDLPIRLLPAQTCPPASARHAIAVALDRLCWLARRWGARDVQVEDGTAGPWQSDIGHACQARDGIPALQFWATADLSLPEDSLRAAVRKSYRPLVNRGRAEMRLEHVCGHHDGDAIAALSRLMTAERRNMDAAVAIYAGFIAAGRAELSLAWRDGQPVAATVTADEGDTSYYAIGVYDKSCGAHASHWPLLDAVLRAKARGQRLFHLGEVFTGAPIYYGPGIVGEIDAKFRSIGFFKSGFATGSLQTIQWRLLP